MPPAYVDAENMRELCSDILTGKIEPIKKEKFFGFQTAEYEGHDTHIVIRKSKIK